MLQYCFCFIDTNSFLLFCFAFWPWGMWHLSFPTRDGTHTPCNGRQSPNHWTTKEVPRTCSWWISSSCLPAIFSFLSLLIFLSQDFLSHCKLLRTLPSLSPCTFSSLLSSFLSNSALYLVEGLGFSLPSPVLWHRRPWIPEEAAAPFPAGWQGRRNGRVTHIFDFLSFSEISIIPASLSFLFSGCNTSKPHNTRHPHSCSVKLLFFPCCQWCFKNVHHLLRRLFFCRCFLFTAALT